MKRSVDRVWYINTFRPAIAAALVQLVLLLVYAIGFHRTALIFGVLFAVALLLLSVIIIDRLDKR